MVHAPYPKLSRGASAVRVRTYLLHFRRGIKAVAVCAAFLVTTSNAWAILSTEVLPKGVRALGLVYANAPKVDSNLNSGGRLESLARPLNRSVTIDDLEAAEPRLKTLRKILNNYSPELALGENIILSNLYSDVSVNEKRYVTGLLWGITPYISAGVIVPYIDREMTANFRADTVNNAARIRALVGNNTPQIPDGLKQIEDMRFDTAFFEQKLFKDNGYQPPRSFRAKGWGDMELEARAKYYEGDFLNLGLRSNLKLPTASHKADITNLLDRDFGDRTVAVRLGSVHTLKLVRNHFFFQSGVFGTWRKPTRQTVALPRNSGDALANLNDPYQVEEVRKELGPQLDVDAGFNLDLFRGAVSFFSSYVFSLKARDVYSGNRELDYERLSAGTKSLSEALESGLELSSVPLFLAKKWPLPAKLVATWVQPVGGKNNLYARYGRLDAILFF